MPGLLRPNARKVRSYLPGLVDRHVCKIARKIYAGNILRHIAIHQYAGVYNNHFIVFHALASYPARAARAPPSLLHAAPTSVAAPTPQPLPSQRAHRSTCHNETTPTTKWAVPSIPISTIAQRGGGGTYKTDCTSTAAAPCRPDTGGDARVPIRARYQPWGQPAVARDPAYLAAVWCTVRTSSAASSCGSWAASLARMSALSLCSRSQWEGTRCIWIRRSPVASLARPARPRPLGRGLGGRPGPQGCQRRLAVGADDY